MDAAAGTIQGGTMKTAIIIIVTAMITGVLVGYYMLKVAQRAVTKVRQEESEKHLKLASDKDEATGYWLDIVNDLHEEIVMGHLAGKDIKSQLAVWNRIVTRETQDDTNDL
jgi:cell division protein FtsX